MAKPLDLDTFMTYKTSQVSAWAQKFLEQTPENPQVINTTIAVIWDRNLHGHLLSIADGYKELQNDYGMPINTAKMIFNQIQIMKNASSKKNARTSSEAQLDEPAKQKNSKHHSSHSPLIKIFKLFVPNAYEGLNVIDWSPEKENKLIKQLIDLKEINTLQAQKKVFGEALTQPLPCYAEGKVFEWLLYNPLTTEFEQFEKAIVPDQNEQESRGVLLLHQVSGSGKTKFAYHLSTNQYVVVLRLLSAVDIVRDLFANATSSPVFSELSIKERIDFAYCSLYITFSWIYAHLAFLELYQKLAADYLNDCDDVHQLFQLIQCNGSLAQQYINFQFKEQMMKLSEFDSGLIAKVNIVSKIKASLDSTGLRVIVFDELLNLRNSAVGCFFHNSMLYENKNKNLEMLYVQQKELQSKYNISTLEIASTATVPTTRTSLVTGFMAMVAELGNKAQIVVTDTSKEVEQYVIKFSRGSRPARGDGFIDYTPNLYFNMADIRSFLSHYFDLKLERRHERLLKHFRGRALFFVRYFFLEWLLGAIKTCKTGAEVAELLAFPNNMEAQSEEAEKQYLLANSLPFRECTIRAADYLAKFLQSSVVDATIKQEISVALATTAGVLNRSRFARIEKDIGQLLGFLLQKKQKDTLFEACVIAEPFIVNAFKKYTSTPGQNPDQDLFLKNLQVIGTNDGVDVGLLLERTIAQIFQRHNGLSFLSIFKNHMQLCGIVALDYEDLFINCTTAGRLLDYKTVNPLLKAWSFAEWANLSAFLFPPNSMKPDGIVMLNGANSTMKGYKDHLTPSTLVTAITTMNPNNFYKFEGKRELNKLKEWQEEMPKLENLFDSCIRIVVSSMGFSEQCFALVREYNKDTKAPIILYSPTANEIGPNLFAKLNIQLKEPSDHIPIEQATKEYLPKLAIKYSNFANEASKNKANKQLFMDQFFSKLQSNQ